MIVDDRTDETINAMSALERYLYHIALIDAAAPWDTVYYAPDTITDGWEGWYRMRWEDAD
jgi:hypothetical protein